LYRFVDAAMVRAATHTSGLDVVPWPDLTDSTSEHVAQWRCWLEQVWAQDAIAAAVEVASPVLARRVGEVCAGRHYEARRVRGMVVSVARYLLRMTGRATPFGLFAGVAPARFGSELAVRHGEDHHAVARVDTEWLAGVITRLETCSELRRRLPVVLNNLSFVRDGRLVVGCQQQPTGPGRTAPAQVSVRHTRAVETVMQAARSPIRVGDLAGKLTAEFPGTPESVIEEMLAELVAQRILVTSLRPPMTATDPLACVVGELTVVGAEEVPQAALLLQELREIHAVLSQHNRWSSPAAGHDVRTSVSRRMAVLSATERPLMVDLRVDCAVVLPHAVAHEAETAATALARLTPYPYGTAAWRDYHTRFLERYGIGAVVPVSEIVNDGAGLGFPAGYRDSRLELPRSSLSERDTRLLILAQNAAIDQNTEVVLDDSAIVDLMAGDFAQTQVQPHTELRFRVHAPTWEAVERGEFTLAVVGVSRAAGTMTGRFLDLLDPGDQDRMFGAYAQLPTVNDDALPVQVSCPPLYPRTANIARSPTVLPHIVSLAEHRSPDEAVIPLEDLAVSGDAQRLYLMSLSRGRPVEPTVFSAVEFTNAAHPLMRFLCEISTARAAACGPFSWGAASRLPFLPRIRYKRTILSPTRWILAASDLPGRDAPWPEWVASLTDWRHRVRVPDAVYLGDDDRRIRLDLDEPAHLHILRSDLNRTGHATVREAPDTDAFGWLDGRAHELVVPLAATSRSMWPPIPQRVTPVHAIGPDHGHLPGNSEWLFVKLYGHPDRHTAILTTHIPSLLSTWDKPPQWWFLPYRDPENHLRLRFRLPDVAAFGQVTRCVGTWAAGLRRLGLIGTVQLDTYYPETGRFGSGAAMAAAECVFAVDSSAALAQRTLTASGSPHPHAVTVASLVDLAVSFLGEVEGGMRWLIDHLSKTPGPATTREVHDQAIHLANPHDEWSALRTTTGGQVLIQAWSARRKALAVYRNRITEAGETEPGCVLACLLHLHHVRMNGIDPDRERVSHRLARAAALRWAAQERREKP
jgi:thiopeptide-type bacteriocin biosynthesis protein